MKWELSFRYRLLTLSCVATLMLVAPGSSTPIYDPQTGNPDGTGRPPFKSNIIPKDRIDPEIPAIFNLGGCGPNAKGSGTFGVALKHSGDF